MGHKAVETTHSINNAFGPRTANERTVPRRFKKFCKGDESLEDEQHGGWPLEVDNNQFRAIIKADPLTTTLEVAEESVDHLQSWHLKQTGKVRKLNKWVLHELTKNQKYHWFELSSSLILCNNNKPFLNWIVMCDKKWILYDNQGQPAHWLNQEEAPKHFPNPNLQKKKKSHGHFLVVCWRSHPLWLSESQQNHYYIWEVRSASRWDAPKTTRPVAGSGQQNGPNSFPQQRVINSSKVEWIRLRCWFSHHIHPTSREKTISSSSISTTFCRENASITSRRQKMLSKGSLNPEAWIFTL